MRWINLSILGEIDFEYFSIILETEGSHSEYDILSIHGLPFFLMTLLRSYH